MNIHRDPELGSVATKTTDVGYQHKSHQVGTGTIQSNVSSWRITPIYQGFQPFEIALGIFSFL